VEATGNSAVDRNRKERGEKREGGRGGNWWDPLSFLERIVNYLIFLKMLKKEGFIYMTLTLIMRFYCGYAGFGVNEMRNK
jgi:hypothetical protein